MKKSVQGHVWDNMTIQRNKSETLSQGGLWLPLAIRDSVRGNLSMKFVQRLRWSSGNYAIMVVMDGLSKYAQFIPLTHSILAATLAQVFICEKIYFHGHPASSYQMATNYS